MQILVAAVEKIEFMIWVRMSWLGLEALTSLSELVQKVFQYLWVAF